MLKLRRRPATFTAVLVTTAMALAGCGGASGSTDSTAQGADSQGGGSSLIAGLKLNKQLHDQLPAKIKSSGTLTSVMSGAFPPYTIPAAGGQQFTGAAMDLQNGLGKILGVKINTVAVDGLSGLLSGLESGRYDFAMGPVGDYADRQAGHDFVDYVQEFVAFLVPAGNPHHIQSLDDICGLSVAVQAGGSAEDVVRTKSKQCVSAGDKAVHVESFPDQPSSTLAVKAGRADAFFSSQAPLMYFAKQTDGNLTVVAKGEPNGFDPIRQGAVFPDGSPLTKVVLEGLKQMFDNGTYDKIMTKYGLQDEMIDQPGLNLGATHE